MFFTLTILLSFAAPSSNAGVQPFTKDTVKKVYAQMATKAQFCKVNATQEELRAFSESILVGSNADEDATLSNLKNMVCSNDSKEIIYGVLRIENIESSSTDSFEQVLIINANIIRPIQYYADPYNNSDILDFNQGTSLYGAVKGIRSFKASLRPPSEESPDKMLPGTTLDSAYYAHLDQNGIVDEFYVLHKGDLFRHVQNVKKIGDIILVDYTSGSPSPDETANWKTYTNLENGFSVKYPDTLQTLENKIEGEGILGSLLPPAAINHNLNLILSLDKKETISISTAINIKIGYGFDAKAGAESLKGNTVTPVKISSIQIGGKDAYKATFVDNSKPYQVYVIFCSGQKNNSAYSIMVTALPQNSQLVDQILSTFKFLE